MDGEFSRLLSAALDGRLEVADRDRLEALLRDGDRDDEFFALMGQHLALGEIAAPVRAFSREELLAVTRVDACFTAGEEPDDHRTISSRSSADSNGSANSNGSGRSGAEQPASTPSPPATNYARRLRLALLTGGLAASLLVMAPLWWSGDGENPQAASSLNGTDAVTAAAPGKETTGGEPEAGSEPHAYAAKIVRKIDCVWGNDRWMISPPQGFRDGEWINLASGLLVLEFESGAVVTLQGPVNASPLSSNALNLVSGGLSASIPERARGFTVHTSSGEIIDLGTEFGVLAGSDGSVETHVFKGKVVTRLGRARGGGPVSDSPITAGQAQRVTPSGIKQSIAAEESHFLRFRAGRDAVMPSQPPVDRGLVLWLAADGRLQHDENLGVMAWGDNLAGPNQDLEDAWQVNARRRPTWVAEAIGGRPAIEFGGNLQLITEPIELGGDVTTTVVFQLASRRVGPDFRRMERVLGGPQQSRADLGLQLVNLFGPPHPVLQINEDCQLRGRVHLGWHPKKIYDNDIGVVESAPLTDDLPHVVVYSFDSTRKIARLLLDGELLCETPVDGELAPTFTPRFIGQHPYRKLHGFPGYIAEVMIHNEALTPEEAAELSEWLGEKYALPVATR